MTDLRPAKKALHKKKARILVACALVFSLASCVAIPVQKPGHSPLTTSEKEAIARVNPAASIVTKLQGQTIEVQNFTMPSEMYRIFGSEVRAFEVHRHLSSYPQLYRIYESAAERHCTSSNRWPNKGTVSGTHSKRFTCYEPKEWALVKMREESQACEQNLLPRVDKDAERFFRQLFQTQSSKLHPCVNRYPLVPWLSPPADFCNAYTNLTKTSPSSEQTCAEYVGMAKRLEISMNETPVQSRGSATGKTFESAKQECTDLGFSPKTEKHADCVLRLTK